MTITADQLREKAMQAMRDAKQEIKRTGNLRPLFRAYFADGKSTDMKVPESCGHLMNIGEAKEILFDWLRQFTSKLHVEAWIFVVDQYRAQATEEGMKHTDEWPKYQDTGFETLQKMGWVMTEEILNIVAQTATDVLMVHQVYVREPKLEWIGPPQIVPMAQSQFSGRMKMYGATTEDITGFDPTRRDAKKIGLDLLNE